MINRDNKISYLAGLYSYPKPHQNLYATCSNSGHCSCSLKDSGVCPPTQPPGCVPTSTFIPAAGVWLLNPVLTSL